MRKLARSTVSVALVLAFVVGGSNVRPMTLEQLNLADLCNRAHQVFRGTVVSITAT